MASPSQSYRRTMARKAFQSTVYQKIQEQTYAKKETIIMSLIRYNERHPIPMSVLRTVILDFDRYAEFIPQVRSCVAKQVESSIWEVAIELFVIRPLFYRIRMSEIEYGHLSWDLLEGVFTTNRGFWHLKEQDNECLVHYEVEVQLGTFLPSVIIKKVQEKAIPDLIFAFVAEAKRRIVVPEENDQDDS